MRSDAGLHMSGAGRKEKSWETGEVELVRFVKSYRVKGKDI